MAVPFKKIRRTPPGGDPSESKYYPQLVTLGQSTDLENIAYQMKEASSLSLGDIQSVLTNFVEAMRTALFNGQSVNIKNFGVFRWEREPPAQNWKKIARQKTSNR